MQINNQDLSYKLASSNSQAQVSFSGAATVKTSQHLNEALKQVKSEIPAGKDGAFIKWLGRIISKVGNTKLFEHITNKPAIAIAEVIVIGNMFKELFQCSIYTIQGLTNESLAPDKRKFIGLFDLCIGIFSAFGGAAMGLLTARYQTQIGEFLLGGKKLKGKLPGFSLAVQGLGILIPLALQQVVTKRIIAPAIATPLAGKMKKHMEEKERAAAKANENMSPIPADSYIYSEKKEDKETKKA